MKTTLFTVNIDGHSWGWDRFYYILRHTDWWSGSWSIVNESRWFSWMNEQLARSLYLMHHSINWISCISWSDHSVEPVSYSNLLLRSRPDEQLTKVNHISLHKQLKKHTLSLVWYWIVQLAVILLNIKLSIKMHTQHTQRMENDLMTLLSMYLFCQLVWKQFETCKPSSLSFCWIYKNPNLIEICCLWWNEEVQFYIVWNMILVCASLVDNVKQIY